MDYKRLSVYISYLLRHHPEKANLDMDSHGWVDTKQLIKGVNNTSKYHLSLHILEEIVANDEKGRYRFNDDHSCIKACQGHSLDWVEPELTYPSVPDILYHGTNTVALEKIYSTEKIDKMNRHAVHMQKDFSKAWKSAIRWRGKIPVVLKIDAKEMAKDGYRIGKTDNDVWCIDNVPILYIIEEIYTEQGDQQ